MATATENKMIETVEPGDVFDLAAIHLKVVTKATNDFGDYVINADAAGDPTKPGYVRCPVLIIFPKGYGFQVIKK